jgi:hypothetical protein
MPQPEQWLSEHPWLLILIVAIALAVARLT